MGVIGGNSHQKGSRGFALNNVVAAWLTGAGAVRATAAELPGRFQIFVAPGPRDAALPSIIIKLDTMTGETWKLVWMELPLPVSAQRPGMNR